MRPSEFSDNFLQLCFDFRRTIVDMQTYVFRQLWFEIFQILDD